MDMRLSADALYDETRLYDLRVVSTLGLTEEDVEAVSAVEGVEGLFPAYDTDLVLLSEEGDSLTARVHSLPEDTSEENVNYLTRPQLLEGRMPQEPGECVIVKTKSLVEGQEWVGATPDGGRGRGRRGGGQLPPAPDPDRGGHGAQRRLCLHGTGIHHRRLRHLGSDALQPCRKPLTWTTTPPCTSRWRGPGS